MPFYNPFWATTSQVHYLTLGMLPMSAVATGSQTAVGSSPNTIQVTYATQDNAYWSQPRTIPAYTYFTFGTTELTEDNVTPVANLEASVLPAGVSNNQYALDITVTSGSASKAYDGNPLVVSYVDPAQVTDDTVYYTGNQSLTITHTLTLSPGTLTVSVPNFPPRVVSASITPGIIRVGGSSFWATLTGYGNVDDADDEESTWVDFGSGNTNNGIGYFFKQELAGGRSLVMAGFPEDFAGKYASITVNGANYTTQIVSDSYNYKAYGGGNIASVAVWVNETLWANILNGAEFITITITGTDPSAT